MEEGRPRRPFSLPSTQYSRPHKGGREEGERGRQAASEEEVVKERQTVRANSVFETCQVEGREGEGGRQSQTAEARCLSLAEGGEGEYVEDWRARGAGRSDLDSGLWRIWIR